MGYEWEQRQVGRVAREGGLGYERVVLAYTAVP